MGIAAALDALNRLAVDGIIGRYAVRGAIAAFYYIEAASTDDLDVLVPFDSGGARSGFLDLSPLIEALKRRGYGEWRRESVMLEGWPVQFLPVADELDQEALDQAVEIAFASGEPGATITTRILGPEHLMAIALRTGRPKDGARLLQFLAGEAFDPSRFRAIVERFGLGLRWREFCASARIDPLLGSA